MARRIRVRAGADPAEAVRDLGARLQRVRSERGITLETLAERTGFSKGYLSRIETGKKTPPLGTLARVADALETRLNALLDGTRVRQAGVEPYFGIVRASERPRALRGASAFGYDYVSLADTQKARHMQPYLFTFPNKIDKYVFFEHEGEEFLFVLSGRVEWQIAHEKHVLKTGDSLYFDARLPHRGRALGGKATAIVVVYSPAASHLADSV